ncbi:MAG: M15 family metallopeptidase [Polyangiaceae bacterium]
MADDPAPGDKSPSSRLSVDESAPVSNSVNVLEDDHPARDLPSVPASASVPTDAEPAPAAAESAPAEPAPAEPASAEPASAEPAPAEPASAEPTPAESDGAPIEPDIQVDVDSPTQFRESPYARTEPFVQERGLYAPPRPARPWSPVRRTLLLGAGLLAPCAVIALSLYSIVKGGASREDLVAAAGAPALLLDAGGVPQVSMGPDDDASAAAVEPTASGALSLENPPMVAAPGFEDEGSDEEPAPSKPAPPKHFATVLDAALGSCSTESVDGLSRQIIEQARCIKPNDFVALPKRPNLIMAPHVYPFLEVGARDHLLKALDSHTNQTMTINSALRTVAQQYLVSHWAATKICGVQLATRPGDSNHEIGSALDIAEAAKWRPALEAQQFRWLGTSDRVHFDYKGDNTGPRTATDVLAFQKLWNRNHAEDPVPENGQYGPPTEQRLKKSPPSGFPLGSSCRPTTRKR